MVTAFLILLGFVRRHLPASVGSNDVRSSSVGTNDVRSNGAGSMEGESVHSESVHPELIHLAKAGLNNQDEQRDMLILEIWTVIAAVLYSAFMYILYLTSFYEEEALVLTSYGRYYGTFIIALIYMAVEVCWYCSYSFRYVKVRVTASAFVLYLLFLHPDVFEKAFLPVRMDTDNDYFYEYRDCGSYIASKTPELSSIYLITRDKGEAEWDYILYNYNAHPRHFSYSPYNENLSKSELRDRVSECGYIYFSTIDDSFRHRYSDPFKT